VAAVGGFCLYITRHKMNFTWAWPELHPGRLMAHLKEASPIGMTELAWAFMWYFCTVLLGFVFADVSLGWFGASHRALMALHTFVWLYFFNLLPSISRCVELPHERLLELMDRSVRFAAWVGLFAAGMLTVAAPLILTVMYGPAFRDAWRSFSVLVWMLPVAMLSGHHRYILVAYNEQKRLLYCTAASAVAAVALSFALVPLYKGQGAAFALLIANVINLILVYITVQKRIVRVPVGRQLMAPLMALAVAAVFYAALVEWNYWAALAVGSVVYLLGLAWSDGRELLTFVQTIVRKPAVKAEAA
jgi:O-antigen/teichoic acid export membrane protein